MIVQYIFWVLIILLSLIIIGIGIYTLYKGDVIGFIPLLIGTVFTFVGITLVIDEGVPTKQDVIDGKAIYQENLHIIDNDTIKTYEIIWKQKN